MRRNHHFPMHLQPPAGANAYTRSPLRHLPLTCLTLVAATAFLPPLCSAQTPAAAGPVTIATADIRPAISQVNQAITNVNISRWKAPNDTKQAAQQDLSSIQRDLSSTLPGLMDTANANPADVGPAFAVYRNIDALYDVLLRVAETATLAGSQADAARLEDALNQLQSARTAFGNSILQAASGRDSEVVQLRTTVAHAAQPAPAAPPQKIVVDDGPASKAATKTTPPKRKKKPATTNPPASAPAPAPNPNGQQPQ